MGLISRIGEWVSSSMYNMRFSGSEHHHNYQPSRNTLQSSGTRTLLYYTFQCHTCVHYCPTRCILDELSPAKEPHFIAAIYIVAHPPSTGELKKIHNQLRSNATTYGSRRAAMRASKCCFDKSSVRASVLVLVLAVPVAPAVMEACVGCSESGRSHRRNCSAGRYRGAGGICGRGAVESDDAAGGRAVAVDLADDGLEGGGRADELGERHEVALAQEGEEIVPDVGGRGALVDEHVLVAGEERRSDSDHVVAVWDEGAGHTGGVDSGGSGA